MAHLLTANRERGEGVHLFRLTGADRRPVEDPAHLCRSLLTDAGDEGKFFGRGRHDSADGTEALQQTDRALRPDAGKALQHKELPRSPALWPIARTRKSALDESLCLSPEVHQQPRGLFRTGGPQERQTIEDPDRDQRPLERFAPDARRLPLCLATLEQEYAALDTGGERGGLTEQPPIDQRRREVRDCLSFHENATLDAIVAGVETGDLHGGVPSRRKRGRNITRLLAIIHDDMHGLAPDVHVIPP